MLYLLQEVTIMIIVIERSIYMRYSKQREALVTLLKSTTTHPDAEWLYENLRLQHPNISLGTVYRNLRQLSENGDILELRDGNISHFDGDISKHHHIICTNCRAIYDLPESYVNPPTVFAEGFDVTGFELMFHGTCPNCKSI